MSDSPVFNLGEGSPEFIAYRLLQDVMQAENRGLSTAGPAALQTLADRVYLLNTYHECLMTVKGRRIAAPKASSVVTG